jgi:hypothetical protein
VAGCWRKALSRARLRTRSNHAVGNSASASGGAPARRRAACSCAARRWRVLRRRGQAAGAPWRRSLRRWADRKGELR